MKILRYKVKSLEKDKKYLDAECQRRGDLLVEGMNKITNGENIQRGVMRRSNSVGKIRKP